MDSQAQIWIAIVGILLTVIGQFVVLLKLAWRAGRNELKTDTMWEILVVSGELNLKRGGHQKSPTKVHPDVMEFINKRVGKYHTRYKIGSLDWEAKCYKLMMEDKGEIVTICAILDISITGFLRMAIEHLLKQSL